MRQRAFIAVCGPSGVGKSTLIKKALQDEDLASLTSIISYTTRVKRPDEIHGEHYFFITKEEFLKKEKKKDFLETTYVYGHYYATSKQQVQFYWNQGKAIIKDVDLQGVKSIKQIYPDSLAIGVFAESHKIKNRIEKRNVDFGKELSLRVQSQQDSEMKELKKHTDEQIINENLEIAYQDFKKNIAKYLCLI